MSSIFFIGLKKAEPLSRLRRDYGNEVVLNMTPSVLLVKILEWNDSYLH